MNGLGRILVGLATGFLGSRLAWLLLRSMFSGPVFRRENYRGRSVATSGGLCLVVAVLVVEASRTIASQAGVGDQTSPVRLLTMLAVFAFALLGLVDDLAATGNDRGFRGHLRALRGGALTTGGLKLFGGALFGVVLVGVINVSFPGRGKSIATLVLDAALIALAANTANLFDRAPGRTTKVSVCSFLLLLGAITFFGAGTDGLALVVPVAVVVGASLGILHDELRERVMLGDAGSNVLGATIGLGVVISGSPSTRVMTCAVLLALNVVSEFVSFSRVIASLGPLRWLDSLGRREPGRGEPGRGEPGRGEQGDSGAMRARHTDPH